ncbi:MAG TPA: tail fiber domain-containing protein, partial [Allocoleopsis sp.]
GAAIGTDNAFPLSIKTDDTSRISIDKVGNISLSGALSVQNTLTVSGSVGIGTTSPSYKLAIAAGDINIDDSRALRQAGRWVIGGNSNVLSIGSSDKSDGRDISFDPGLAGALTIKKDTGNVGIGTTSPNYKLAIAAGDINIDDGRALRQAGRWVIGGNSNVLSIGSSNAPDGRDIRFDPGFSGALTVKKDTGNVGIGTTNPTYKLEVAGDVKASSIHSKTKLFGFKIDGDFDKFYPVIFSDDENWGEGPIVLEINRPDVHTDSLWRGALNSKFTFHSTAWGHGADFCRAEIYYSQNQFIAGYKNYYFYRRFVVWLRGGGTAYYWRANPFITLVDYSAKEKVITVNNDDRTAVTYPVKTNIDPYVLSYGISFDQNFVVQGNVGIGTTNLGAKLDISGGDVRWGNNSRLQTDQGGSIELGGNSSTPGSGTPYIDFHFAGLTQDFNTRIINDANGRLSLVANEVFITGRLREGSSRQIKENIENLTIREAFKALKDLNPVKFKFRADSSNQIHLGFIAEDVPTLVATVDRKAICISDIVALITKVVKEQQNKISVLSEKIKALEEKQN